MSPAGDVADPDVNTLFPGPTDVAAMEVPVRFVPSLAHGVADYLVGLGMIVLAFASGAEGAGFIAYLLLGLFAIVYALLTDYELGWKPVLTLPAHLALDAAFAVAMLLLPLLFTLPVMLLWTSVAIAFMAGVLVATTKMP